jgi:SNF2 family DNA or RNA helicase
MNKTLRDFQTTGSAFLQANRHAILCDDAGLGKSATALDAADTLGLTRVLCIGPAVAGVSWPLQVAEWSPGRVFVDLDMARSFGVRPPGFYFVSFDALSRGLGNALHRSLLTCPSWDLVLIDEGQYIKSPGAKRTQAVYGPTCSSEVEAITRNARSVWVLSGTLTPNHAGEAYTHLRALFRATLAKIPAFKGVVPEQHEYENYFCDVRDTVYGRVISGSKNMGVLRDAIAPVMLRRRKIDVMPELPPMEFFTAPIKTDPLVVEQIFRDGLAAQGVKYDPRIHALTEDDIQALAGGMDATVGPLATLRRNLGAAKLAGCAEWVIARLVAGDPKVIVFAYHREVIAALETALLDFSPVVYTGSTSKSDRAENVRLFQEDPRRRVFIGQLMAAGTAITLTAAKTVFFAEFAGTPGVNYQAASRPHRIGQRAGVQVYFGTVPNSLDEKIAATAARRAKEIAEIFD